VPPAGTSPRGAWNPEDDPDSSAARI